MICCVLNPHNCIFFQFSSKNNDVSALSNRVSELEVENEELQSKLQSLHEIGTQNGKRKSFVDDPK